MATTMAMADMDLVEAGTPGAQRVAVLQSPGHIEMRWARVPEPGEGQIRVRIKWVGICGSDLEAYRGTRKPEFISTPARLGHEVAGIIDQVGPGVVGVKVGDQVTCRYVWGAFAEYIVCRPFNVKVLPAGFPIKETSLIEVLPGVIHTAELSAIGPNTRVLITGQGVSGLVLTQVLSLYSPQALAVTDLKERNLELARHYGATHTYRIPTPETPTMDIVGKDFPEGFDVVVPCLLEGDGMIDALECCALGARIVMYGCIGVCNQPFDFFKVHRKRVEIYSTEPRRDIDMRRFFEESIRLVLDGLVNTGQMVTHQFPLEEIDQAFALRNDKSADAIHVLIDCERKTPENVA
ncbi:MAG: alcohol dehydrogenase catalytic domain-containing protein [Phycisphaeraceae bacterium]|nr:alcohol dehydrogenase catalytic domain-containing protein [Phycisphaeraceae bacterium]